MASIFWPPCSLVLGNQSYPPPELEERELGRQSYSPKKVHRLLTVAHC